MPSDPQTSDAISKLQALAQTPARSKTSKLRDLLTEIEALKLKGYTNRIVLAVLNDAGFSMSLKTFESILHRLRKTCSSPSVAEQRSKGSQAQRSPIGAGRAPANPLIGAQPPGNPGQLRQLRMESAEKAEQHIRKESV